MLPFMISSDVAPFVLVRSSGKEITCLSELSCDSTQSLGLTEISLEGHDLMQQVQACQLNGQNRLAPVVPKNSISNFMIVVW